VECDHGVSVVHDLDLHQTTVISMKTRFARVILAAAAILLFMPSGLLAQDAQSAGAGR